MEASTTNAIPSRVGKVIEVGADLYKSQGAQREQAVGVGSDGKPFLVGHDVQSPFGSGFDDLEPVPFAVDLVPDDEWAAEALSVDMPAIVVIEDLDPRSPLDSLTEASDLGRELEGVL